MPKKKRGGKQKGPPEMPEEKAMRLEMERLTHGEKSCSIARFSSLSTSWKLCLRIIKGRLT